jgi:hypothetical protein
MLIIQKLHQILDRDQMLFVRKVPPAIAVIGKTLRPDEEVEDISSAMFWRWSPKEQFACIQIVVTT